MTFTKKKSIILIIIFFLFFLITNKNILAINWEDYIENGIYYAYKNGRKIKCGRVGEDDPLRRFEWYDFRQADTCWNHRCDWGMCQGEVPLCCYKLEETRNAKACAWPERGYCHPRQCDKISGDKLLCSHGIGYWCKKDCGISDKYQIPYIPFYQRVNNNLQTTPTNPPPSPTPTSIFTLTPTSFFPSPTYPLIPSENPTPTPTPFLFFTPMPTQNLNSGSNQSFTPTPFDFFSQPTKPSHPQSPSPSPLLSNRNNKNFFSINVNENLKKTKEKIKDKLIHATYSSEKFFFLFKEIFIVFNNLDNQLENLINENINKIIKLPSLTN